MKHPATTVMTVLSLLCGALGCGDDVVTDAGPSYPATATFGHEQGVDMLTGVVFLGGAEMPEGTFANSDLFAKNNGSALKLYSGGLTSAKNRPVEWFQTGGTADEWPNLAGVPNEPLPVGDGSDGYCHAVQTCLPLTHAEQHNGFIVAVPVDRADPTAGFRYFKGYLASASATSVTIEYQPLP